MTETSELDDSFHVFDTTLRDGAQREGINLTVADKIAQLAKLDLVDYKVRILEGVHGTQSTTRVLISTSDGAGEWSTVGVAENVIAASWQALEDAYAYGLLRAGVERAEVRSRTWGWCRLGVPRGVLTA
ncbi:(R)-citramalate synthase OS=Streptomyces alboniger OX=132473 GN=CP975_25450 PE=3 SV=1 [Streptomyces alboniger]